jgi:hypothetical protein
MKIIAIIALSIMITGCGWLERGGAYITGYAETCIDNVLYYQFPSGVTVAYNEDGLIKGCE